MNRWMPISILCIICFVFVFILLGNLKKSNLHVSNKRACVDILYNIIINKINYVIFNLKNRFYNLNYMESISKIIDFNIM